MVRYLFVTLIFVLLLQISTDLTLIESYNELISTKAFPVKGGDLGGTLWLYNLPIRIFLPGKDFLWTDMTCYPAGERLTNITPNFIDALFFKPFSLLPFPFGYNLFIILILYSNFILTYYFFRNVVAHWFFNGNSKVDENIRVSICEVVPFLAGFLFSITPVISGELNHGRPTNVILFPLPLSLIFLEKGLRRKEGRLRNYIVSGMIAGLSGWIYIFYLPCILIIALSFTVYLLNHRGKAKCSEFILPFLIIIIFATLFTLIYYRIVSKEALSSIGGPPLLLPGVWVPTPWLTRDHIMVKESLDIFFPFKSPYQLYEDFYSGVIPLSTILLIMISLLSIKKNLPLLSGIILFYLLSLGPFLKTGQTIEDGSPLIPLPFYLLLKVIPAISRFHHLSRFLLFFNFLLSSLLLTIPSMNIPPAFSRVRVFLMILFLIIFIPILRNLSKFCRISTIDLPDKDILHEMTSLQYPVLHLPFGTEREHLFFQSIHNQPLINCIDDDGAFRSDSAFNRLFGSNSSIVRLKSISEGVEPIHRTAPIPEEMGYVRGVILSLNALRYRFPDRWKVLFESFENILTENGFKYRRGDRWIRIYRYDG